MFNEHYKSFSGVILLSDWWRFYCGIMGNVIFTKNFTVKQLD